MLEIVAAIRLRKVITNEWWLVLGGALSIVFGAFIAAAPVAGTIALVFWIGAYAIVFGRCWSLSASRLRRRHSGALDEAGAARRLTGDRGVLTLRAQRARPRCRGP